MNITKNLRGNHTTGRNGHIPDVIMIHTTGSTQQQSVINAITNPNHIGSYHYIIDTNGDITQMVDIRNQAWHSGSRQDGGNQDPQHSTNPLIRNRRHNINLYSIGIGLVQLSNTGGIPTDKQFKSLAWLIEHIRREVHVIFDYVIPLMAENITCHGQALPRHRPPNWFDVGNNFPWQKLMHGIVEKTEDKTMVFNKVEDFPNWAVPTIEKLIAKGALAGDSTGFNLTLEMVRIFVIHDRMGLYEER